MAKRFSSQDLEELKMESADMSKGERKTPHTQASSDEVYDLCKKAERRSSIKHQITAAKEKMIKESKFV